jgi:hypothetical protein
MSRVGSSSLFGSKADLTILKCDIRYTPRADIVSQTCMSEKGHD